MGRPKKITNLPLVTLLTPTGGRPEAFAFLEKMLMRQTYKGPIQWIIVDDCTPETKITIPSDINIKPEYYRGPKEWRKGINTQRPNMEEAMKHIKGDTVIISEDDDFIAPNYLEVMLQLLQLYPIVGNANSTYYNIHQRCWKEWRNVHHASLCQTALRKEHLDVLDEAVNSGELFMDCSFWKKVIDKQIPHILFMGLPLVCGMKGLPGRFGIGAGHTPEKENFIKDPNFVKLKELVGADWEFYANLAAKLTPEIPKKPSLTAVQAVAKAAIATQEATQRAIKSSKERIINNPAGNTTLHGFNIPEVKPAGGLKL